LIDFDIHLIIEVNERAEAIYGYDRRELIGMSPSEIVPQEEHAEIWTSIRDLYADEELVTTERLCSLSSSSTVSDDLAIRAMLCLLDRRYAS
jgi:PAS domain-containing protein